MYKSQRAGQILRVCLGSVVFSLLLSNKVQALRMAAPITRNDQPSLAKRQAQADKDVFLDELVDSMTLAEQGMRSCMAELAVELTGALVHQVHLMFADNIIGPASDNSQYGEITQGSLCLFSFP